MMTLYKYGKFHYTLCFTEVNIQNKLANKIMKLMNYFLVFFGLISIFVRQKQQQKINSKSGKHSEGIKNFIVLYNFYLLKRKINYMVDCLLHEV